MFMPPCRSKTFRGKFFVGPPPLQEQKNKDDILPKLMGGAEASEATFKEELKKYDELVKEVRLGFMLCRCLRCVD